MATLDVEDPPVGIGAAKTGAPPITPSKRRPPEEAEPAAAAGPLPAAASLRPDPELTATVEVVEPPSPPAELAEAAPAGPLFSWKAALPSRRRPEVTATVEVVDPRPDEEDEAAAAPPLLFWLRPWCVASAGVTISSDATQNVENFIFASERERRRRKADDEKKKTEEKKDEKVRAHLGKKIGIFRADFFPAPQNRRNKPTEAANKNRLFHRNRARLFLFLSSSSPLGGKTSTSPTRAASKNAKNARPRHLFLKVRGKKKLGVQSTLLAPPLPLRPSIPPPHPLELVDPAALRVKAIERREQSSTEKRVNERARVIY